MIAQAGALSDALFFTPIKVSTFPNVTRHTRHKQTPELRTRYPLVPKHASLIQSREKSGISVEVTKATDHWGYVSCLSLLEFDSGRKGALPLSSNVKLIHNAVLHILMLLLSKWFVHLKSELKSDLKTGCTIAAYAKSRLKRVSMEAHPLKMVLVKGLILIALHESRFEKQVDILHNVIALLVLLKHNFNHTSFWHWTTNKNNNNIRRIGKQACFAKQKYLLF